MKDKVFPEYNKEKDVIIEIDPRILTAADQPGGVIISTDNGMYKVERLELNIIKATKSWSDRFDEELRKPDGLIVPKIENHGENIISSPDWDKSGDKIKSFIQQELDQQRADLEKEVGEINNRKYPRGERPWCKECSSRLIKDVIKLIRGKEDK